MPKYLPAVSSLIGLLAPTLLFASEIKTSSDPLAAFMGHWQRGDGVARVNVTRCGNATCMTNIWIKPGSDEKVGEYLMFEVKPAGSGVFNGTGQDPQRNVRFSFDVTISNDSMTTKGCIVGGIICRTTNWTRTR